MAVPGKSDDPTEAVMGVAMQMEVTGTTSGSSASDTCALLEVKNGAVSTRPHVPEGTAPQWRWLLCDNNIRMG
jgi:hypothetical protein